MTVLKDKQGIQPELRRVFKEISLPMPAITDLDGAADLEATVAKINEILAALRTSGLIES